MDKRGPEYIPFEQHEAIMEGRRRRRNRRTAILSLVLVASISAGIGFPLKARRDTLEGWLDLLAFTPQIESTITLQNTDGTPFDKIIDEDDLRGRRRIVMDDGKIKLFYDGFKKVRYEAFTGRAQEETGLDTFSPTVRQRIRYALHKNRPLHRLLLAKFGNRGAIEVEYEQFTYRLIPGTGEHLLTVQVFISFDDVKQPVATWDLNRIKNDSRRFIAELPAGTKSFTHKSPVENPAKQSFADGNLELLDWNVNIFGDQFLLDRSGEEHGFVVTRDESHEYLRMPPGVRADVSNTRAMRSRMRFAKRMAKLNWPIKASLDTQDGTRRLGNVSQTFAKPTVYYMPDYEFASISDSPYWYFKLRTAFWKAGEADTGLPPSFVGTSETAVPDGRIGAISYHQVLAYALMTSELIYVNEPAKVYHGLYRCYRSLGSTENALRAVNEGMKQPIGDQFYVDQFKLLKEELEDSL